MICKTYDFDTPEQLLRQQIEKELNARTPEEIAKDTAHEKEQFQRLLESQQQYWVRHKKVCNKKKIEDFIKTATTLQNFTKNHTGWIKIKVTDECTAVIEMRFAALFFMDIDAYNSHAIFANLFRKFQDIHITANENKVVIHVFLDLFDIIEVPVPEATYSPS